MIPQKTSLFFILTCAFCLFISTTVHAKVEPSDLSHWTKHKLKSYLDKYNILYDPRSDEITFSGIVKDYTDAVTASAQYFGERVENTLSNLKIQLEKDTGITKTNVEAILKTVQHILHRLELKGELSADRIKEHLDKARATVIKKNLVTEAQWKKFVNDVNFSFNAQTWEQRLTGKYPTDFTHASASLHKWLRKIADRLIERKEMTEDQVIEIVDHIKETIVSSDITQLGDPEWYKDIGSRIESKTQLGKDRVKEIVNSIERDINAYKIFSTDYIGTAANETHQLVENIADIITDQFSSTINRLQTTFQVVKKYIRPHFWPIYQHHDVAMPSLSATVSEKGESIKSSLSIAVNTAAAAISNAAVDTAKSLKNSFANFWYDSEMEAYRRLGYTEAQVNWVQRYLAQTFQHNKPRFTSQYINEALGRIREFLNESKVQPSSEIEKEVEKMKKHIESWIHNIQA
ncbi:hypothetical protein BDF14DRAFT_1992926 [Spinellus fusiger]|nr:hypothetical protein BDF14DRAFT_1992926 [Spinellus fusiger]